MYMDNAHFWWSYTWMISLCFVGKLLVCSFFGRNRYESFEADELRYHHLCSSNTISVCKGAGGWGGGGGQGQGKQVIGTTGPITRLSRHSWLTMSVTFWHSIYITKNKFVDLCKYWGATKICKGNEKTVSSRALISIYFSSWIWWSLCKNTILLFCWIVGKSQRGCWYAVCQVRENSFSFLCQQCIVYE